MVCVSTTSFVVSLVDMLGDSTSVNCSTNVVFDFFFGRALAFGIVSISGSGCSVCTVLSSKLIVALSAETDITFGFLGALLDSRFALLGFCVSTTSSASTGAPAEKFTALPSLSTNTIIIGNTTDNFEILTDEQVLSAINSLSFSTSLPLRSINTMIQNTTPRINTPSNYFHSGYIDLFPIRNL
ncbi:MAG: hypothetical protein ACKPKO_43215, partial [Candidatus Fonsibacter sp.]